MYAAPEFVKEAMAQLVPYHNASKASSASNFVGPLSWMKQSPFRCRDGDP
jgi:hypothetical protein